MGKAALPRGPGVGRADFNSRAVAIGAGDLGARAAAAAPPESSEAQILAK
jgi:hypothetical protein